MQGDGAEAEMSCGVELARWGSRAASCQGQFPEALWNRGATHLSRVLPGDFSGEHVTDLQPRAWHGAESLLLGFPKLQLILHLDRFFFAIVQFF